MNRREFFQLSLGMGAVGLINLAAGHLMAKNPEPRITLPELPYPSNGLEPWISSQTLAFHHGKHHQAYVTNTLKLIAGTDMENRSPDRYHSNSPSKADDGAVQQRGPVLQS